MISFKNDYSEGAHPRILEALIQHNMTQEEGYGLDRHTQAAIKQIQELIGSEVLIILETDEEVFGTMISVEEGIITLRADAPGTIDNEEFSAASAGTDDFRLLPLIEVESLSVRESSRSSAVAVFLMATIVIVVVFLKNFDDRRYSCLIIIHKTTHQNLIITIDFKLGTIGFYLIIIPG